MNAVVQIILIPLLAGLLLLFIPERLRTVKGIAALIVSIITAWLTIRIYGGGQQFLSLAEITGRPLPSLAGSGFLQEVSGFVTFNCDSLSKLIILFISLLAFLVLLYSLVYIKAGRVSNYYPWFLITLGCSYGAVMSDNLLLFLIFWGMLGITLYMLLPGHDEESSA
ncbi:MAG: hypothetical protein E4G92_04490, partial [Bacteroidia bacterium]